MVFSSSEFVLLFFPLTLLLYYSVPKRFLMLRNTVLLTLSLVFYGWGEPLYLFLMVASILVTYSLGLLVSRAQKKNAPKKAKLWLIVGVVFNIGLLGFFKYYDFIVSSLAKIPFLSFMEGAVLGIGLPIGISFYTFQIMSYLIDVYRGDGDVQKNPLMFGTYVSFFPQLIAGPIVKYRDIDTQLSCRQHNVDMFTRGIKTFIAGFGKKVIIANSAGAVFEDLTALPPSHATVVGSWLAVIMYSFQLYFDFSAYSDMAIGIGRMFGFEFMENFNYPYISKSITEFWRRWHISLSTWFKEYVYIPLGGSRVAKRSRAWFNIFAVWALTGIWHGANWNFLFWGLYYFLFLCIEKTFLKKFLDKMPSVLRHVYTLTIVLFGWLLFCFTDISEGFAHLGHMFGLGVSGFISENVVYILAKSAVLIVVAILASTPLPKKLYYKLIENKNELTRSIGAFGAIVLLLVCIAYVCSSGYNPFLYSRF
ncbi:MAG: MBOAT family protein [Ruminococcaceae bacterium]|nr:MBOAT family protein [Oscillospiraceae bacterium]